MTDGGSRYHQYSTMEKEPDKHRIARHWYDVDCMLRKSIVDPLVNTQARLDVVEMKKQSWSEKGVDYEAALRGELKLLLDADRLAEIAKDHESSIKGRMFFVGRQPDRFDQIIDRLLSEQERINKETLAEL